MEIGVWLPNCRHLATREIIRRVAVRAEALGYESLWVSDHVIVPEANVQNFGETVYDPFITLAVAAGATERVRLGTTVLIVPYRQAVLTAKMVSSLDDLSGGRLILGVGAGWLPVESAMLNVPFEERGPMTDEYLRAMQVLWTDPNPVFDGRYIHFRDLKFYPRPIQRPHPPIWVGGHSRAALRRSVEFGAAWHPINLPVADLRAAQATLADLSRAANRPAPALTLRNDVQVVLSGTKVREGTHRGRVITGTPDQLVGQLRELAEIGVEHLVVEFLADDGDELDAQMTTFAREVRPAL